MKTKYLEQIFEKKNLIFGLIWGLLAYFIGNFIVQIIEFINMVTGVLTNAALYVFAVPSQITRILHLQQGIMAMAVVIAIAILLSPFARKAFDWLRSIFRKTSI